MIWQVGEAGTNQAKERISGEMLASLRGNDRHGNPRLENLKSFQGEGYCRIDVYEKATGISRWLLGFVALRELLKLEVLTGQATQWVSFVDQYDPKSPWSDTRVRLAANHAVNWQAINEAENLGYATLTGGIIPRKFAYTLQLEPYGYDPKKAQQLLKDAGYANGFDAGECSTDTPYASVVEAIVNDLAVVGIRTRVRSMERAAIQTAQKEKTVKHLTRQGSGAFGNAATRIEAFMYSKGTQSFLRDPDLDAWYTQQVTARDPQQRAALLHKIQQKAYDEARLMPIWESAFLCASGPRVAVSGLHRDSFAYSAPYEDVRLKSA